MHEYEIILNCGMHFFIAHFYFPSDDDAQYIVVTVRFRIMMSKLQFFLVGSDTN